MAFIYREEKLKNIRPNTALGPGEYLPISKDKKIKNNNMNAPFESNVKRFNPLYGELNSIRNATPGPGKYYSNELRLKTKKLENLAKIKYSNMEDFIPNKSQKGYNFYPAKEKLGFDIKAQRFKIDSNSNPGPGEYFNTKKNKNFKESKKRARSALYLINNYAPKNDVLVPSIPYRDNGFEIGENNSLIKLESPNEGWKENEEKLGPGSYDVDNPNSWFRTGTSWSKMKVEREMNIKEQNNIKDITRPETAIDLNINGISVNSLNKQKKIEKKNFRTLKRIPIYYQMMKGSINDGKKIDNLQVKKRNEIPGPGYYLDIMKDSTFYKDTIPYPESKQFFMSNNERFTENKNNEFLGPATYFMNNNYYNSPFNPAQILKKKDKNKIKKAPFSSREKRFNSFNNKKMDEKTPGPGEYDPKIIKVIESNKFNNKTNTFNFRTKRFGTAGSDFKWKASIPGPGSYINPYTATGTSNTLLINGLYLDIRKGKDILRPKSKKTIPLKKQKLSVPDVGMFNPGLISSISYKNKKKIEATNKNLKVAFNTNIKYEKNKQMRTNIGPGYYYHPKQKQEIQINPPFYKSETKFPKSKNYFGLGPGYYDSSSYFDWNKKSYNSSFY